MKKKVEVISGELAASVSQWDGIVAIVLGEAAGIETIDPYFNIDIDVYYSEDIPDRDDRKERLGNPAGFETAFHQTLDQFFVQKLPVSLTYKKTERIDTILQRVLDGLWAFRNETTNLLYRVREGKILYQDGDWFERARARLDDVPEVFWDNLKTASRLALDRHLNDVGAAVYRGDYLFYQMAEGGFLKSLCSFLFALNKKFEPSGRLMLDHIVELEQLPGEFSGRFENLIRPDIEITAERRHEISKLVAKSLSYL